MGQGVCLMDRKLRLLRLRQKVLLGLIEHTLIDVMIDVITEQVRRLYLSVWVRSGRKGRGGK